VSVASDTVASNLAPTRALALAAALISIGAGCGGASEAHDVPVPANEGRETIEVVLDLPPGAACEETFELALYEDRGVDLVTWAPGGRGCTGRAARVRFLPGRVSRAALVQELKTVATKVEVR
jgi:hypothetical protein